MDIAYLANIAFWVVTFGLIGAILQLALKAFGITFGLGGAIFVALSILQDSFGAGPTFLYYIPFNVPNGFTVHVPPWVTTALLFVISVASMFLVERSISSTEVY